MVGTHRNPLVIATLALLATGAIVFGLVLRLEDPLSSPVIPAEDPYTHMALVREHLRDGTLDPLNEPGTLYPPGMHALLAAVVVYTGADLYDVARIAPALFGALGLLGLALLLGRFEGMGAAVAGVLALAVLPEAIFRTQMLSPTALDLMLLPFLAYSILQVLQGKLAWAGAAGAIALFLLLSHPWVFGILGVAGLALLLLVTLLPWSAQRGPLPTAWGVATVVAIIGTGIGMSLSGCWGGCGPGFRDVLPEQGNLIDGLSGLVLVGSLIPLAVKALRPKALRQVFPLKRDPLPFAARVVVSQVLAMGAVATFFVAGRNGWPPQVDLMVMIGWPILLLAVIGLAALPFRPSPAGHVGAAIALATMPFVVFDPFNSPFWSHRTAVYFTLGVAMLCGVAIAALVQAAVAIANRLPAPTTASGPAGAPLAAKPARSAGTSGVMVATGLLVLVVFAGGVYAATPEPYKGGWYRLYGECEFGGLRDIGGLAETGGGRPAPLVITGTWQSKLVLSALADDASRMWYKPDFYESGAERANVIRMLEEQGRPVIVVVDSLMATEHPATDTSFLQSDPWVQLGQWCAGEERALAAYTVGA